MIQTKEGAITIYQDRLVCFTMEEGNFYSYTAQFSVILVLNFKNYVSCVNGTDSREDRNCCHTGKIPYINLHHVHNHQWPWRYINFAYYWLCKLINKTLKRKLTISIFWLAHSSVTVLLPVIHNFKTMLESNKVDSLSLRKFQALQRHYKSHVVLRSSNVNNWGKTPWTDDIDNNMHKNDSDYFFGLPRSSCARRLHCRVHL